MAMYKSYFDYTTINIGQEQEIKINKTNKEKTD